jgi:hypothetical protein
MATSIGCQEMKHRSMKNKLSVRCFYDAMPSTWCEQYIQAGHLSVSMTIAQPLCYFCQQEHLAIPKQLENQSSQCSQHKTSTPKHRFTPRGSVKESTTENCFSGSASKSKLKTTTGKRIADTAPCPVHPDMGHNWGDCYSNAYNKKQKSSTDDRSKQDKNKSTNFVVKVSASSTKDDDVKMNSGSEDELLNNTRKCFAPINYCSSHHIDTCCPSFVQAESSHDVDSYSSFIMNTQLHGAFLHEEELLNPYSDTLLPLHLHPIGLLLP